MAYGSSWSMIDASIRYCSGLFALCFCVEEAMMVIEASEIVQKRSSAKNALTAVTSHNPNLGMIITEHVSSRVIQKKWASFLEFQTSFDWSRSSER